LFFVWNASSGGGLLPSERRKAFHAVQEQDRYVPNEGARLRATGSEQDWEELAIEWHTMANFAARGSGEITLFEVV
jgi:hypothetical protein